MYKAFVKMADVFSKSKRSEIMGKIRSRDTGLEKRAEAMLGGSGIEFESHPKIFGSPDFIVGGRILLFCDSSFWHGRDWENLKRRLEAGNNPDYWVAHIRKNRARDKKVTAELGRAGYVVLRLWDDDIFKRPEWCVETIRRILSSV